MTSSNI